MNALTYSYMYCYNMSSLFAIEIVQQLKVALNILNLREFVKHGSSTKEILFEELVIIVIKTD